MTLPPEPRSRRKVYFSGAIRGGRRLQPLYAQIVRFLGEQGYEVLGAHVADPDVLTKEWRAHVADPDVLTKEWRPGIRASDIYARDLRWLAACDVVVAEVSVPSLGVGVELAEAQHLGKPVICLCEQDVALSAMVGGNEYFRHIRYRDPAELLHRLADALTAI